MPDYLHTKNQYITVGEASIAYRMIGNNAKELPILLLNHLSATMDEWDPAFINELARDNRVIVVDLSGVGASSGKTQTSISQMAKEVIDFILTLGFSKVNLLGLSMGGFIAQGIVRQDPNLINKLILVGTGPKGGVGIDKVSEVTFKSILKAQLHRVDPKTYIFYPHDPKGEKEAFEILSRMKQRPAKFADKKITISSFLCQLKAIHSWGKEQADSTKFIKIPTLIINGDNDIMVPTANSYEMHYKIKNSKLVIYPHAGHGSIFQYPLSSVKEINLFLHR